MSYVNYPEIKFLELTAARIHRLQEEAVGNGTVFNDLGSFQPIGCGVRVRMRFVKNDAGELEPQVQLKPHPAYTGEELQQIAGELLQGAAGHPVSGPDGVLYYTKLRA